MANVPDKQTDGQTDHGMVSMLLTGQCNLSSIGKMSNKVTKGP